VTPPRIWDRDLTSRERRGLADLLARSPGLWPFGIVMGEMGLDGAIDACRDPNLITQAAADSLREAHYPPAACLPSYPDVLTILMGVRLKRRLDVKNRLTLQAEAKRQGLTLKEAQYALRLAALHGDAPAYEALKP